MRILLSLLLLLCSVNVSAQSENTSWQHFYLQDLIVKQVTQNKRYLPFLDEKSLSAGIYELRTQDEDRQQPHMQDEIYFILNGKSRFEVGDQSTNLKQGDVLFVRAGIDHKFVDISEDLRTLVWFSGSQQTDHDFLWKKWSAPHQAVPKQSSENTWDIFLEIPSMITGVYSLPHAVGGDSVLTQKVDQINYVVKGSAKFAVDAEVMEVSAGSIIYVKAGAAHRFFDLKDDFQVYIMFPQ